MDMLICLAVSENGIQRQITMAEVFMRKQSKPNSFWSDLMYVLNTISTWGRARVLYIYAMQF